MKVTWLIPDCYSFLLDEIAGLVQHVDSLTVLSCSPVTKSIQESISNVNFQYCPESSFMLACLKYTKLREIIDHHGTLRVLRSGWHLRKIAGVYTVLFPLIHHYPQDIIHSHFACPGGLGGTLVDECANVLTLRGYDILTTGDYGALWNPFYRYNLMNSFANNVLITVASTQTLEYSRKILGPEANLQLLPNGINLESFKASEQITRKSLGISKESIVLVAVGNLIPLKNYAMLIESLAEVRLIVDRSIHLVICGDGILLQNLKDMSSRLGISQNIHFLGHLSRDKLTDIYKLSNILVHPSLSEGFGNIIVEGFWHRLVVVASPVGAAVDLIQDGENGYLAQIGNKRALARSLVKAIGDLPELSAVLDENRELIQRKYTLKKRITGYLDVYKKALNS